MIYFSNATPSATNINDQICILRMTPVREQAYYSKNKDFKIITYTLITYGRTVVEP